MASVNKAIIVGNLGRDPELRTFPSGDQIATVSIATTDKWKDKQSGEMRERTEWHNIVFTGRLAEIAGQYLRKGSQVYVEGRIQTRKWQDQNGNDRYTTEIRADTMQMLGSRQGMGGPGADSYHNAPAPRQQQPSAPREQAAARQTPPPPPSAAGFDDMDDDIPF